jgi:2-iminobutanoate/2-iminopropanoate deaminase
LGEPVLTERSFAVAKKEPIAVPALPAPANPLSRAVRVGDLVFLAGTGGRNPETNEFGDTADQVRCALEIIRTVLDAAGTSLENVVSVTTYLKNREDAEVYNEVYRSFFPKDPPARTTIQTELMNPDMRVEITCVAAMPG